VVPLCFIAIYANNAMALIEETNIQSLSIEDLLQADVVSVSLFDKPINQVPAVVNIVPGADFKRYGWRTVADMLRTVPGFYISNPERAYPLVGVMGLASPAIYNEDILVLLDGHRMNENMYDQGLLGDDSIFDVDLIDHVEIIRGPASSIYGGNALMGAINVVTKTGRDFNGAEIGLALGSGRDRGGRVTYGTELDNGGDFLISATRRTSEGFSVPLDNSPISANNVEGISRNSFISKIKFDAFEIEAASYARYKSIPIGIYGTTINDLTYVQEAHSFLDIKSRQELGQNLYLLARTYYDIDPAKYVDSYPTYRVIQNGDSRSLGLDFQVIDKSFTQHQIVYGVEIIDRYFAVFSQNYTNNYQPNVAFNDSRKFYAGFFQDEFRVNQNWSFTARLRCDNNGIVFDICSPGFALVNNSSGAGIFKSSYGSAFRSPNIYERSFGGTLQNNIQTERIKSINFSWDSSTQDSLRLHADVYRYSMTELIGGNMNPKTNGTFTYLNLGDVSAYGGVLSVEKNWSPDLGAKISYSFSHARLYGSQLLDNSPDHLIKANVHFPISSHWLGGYELQYCDRRLAQGSNIDGSALTSTMLPYQFVNNLTAKFSESKHSPEWTFSIYNLFNRKLIDPADDGLALNRLYVQQNSREYRAAVRIPF